VDAAESLSALMTLSPDVRRCALVELSGAVVASSPAEAGDRLARTANDLLGTAPSGSSAVASVEVGLDNGTVFVVGDGALAAIAVTGPEPPSALVLHDLRECLKRISAAAPDA
jgi:hypothetical protein